MKPRAGIAVLAACVLAWVAMVVARERFRGHLPPSSVATPSATPHPAGPRAVVHLPNVGSAFDGALHAAGTWIGGWITSGKVPLVVIGALVVLGWLARVIRTGIRLRSTEQDPQRMFSPEQRREAFGRAGDRCEYTGLFGARCRAAAEHADHAFPWTLGGATSLDNCVASCARHNLSKGAKVLTRRQVRRLERRRRGYFHPGADVTVERRYVDAAASAASSGRPSQSARRRVEQPPAAPARVPSPWSGYDEPFEEADGTSRSERVEESTFGW